MPTMRIYASDCVSLPVQADRRTGALSWDMSAAKRIDSVTLESVYSFEYDGYYVYPPVHSCTGALLTFDLGAVPALGGAKVTGISGPWVYLSGRAECVPARQRLPPLFLRLRHAPALLTLVRGHAAGSGGEGQIERVL